MKKSITMKRITALCVATVIFSLMCIIPAFATDSTSNSRVINGNTLTCRMYYVAAENEYFGGELDITSTWDGVATKMGLAVETVDYYTGQALSFGNNSQIQYATNSVDFFWWTPITSSRISVYSCTDLYLGTTGYSLYTGLEGVDGLFDYMR